MNLFTMPTGPVISTSIFVTSMAHLHLDFASPFQGKIFLILIDTHSKWIEAVCTSTTLSSVVIEELHTIFAKFGLPETVVTDNGTGFVSQEFESFLVANGIKHVTSESILD